MLARGSRTPRRCRSARRTRRHTPHARASRLPKSRNSRGPVTVALCKRADGKRRYEGKRRISTRNGDHSVRGIGSAGRSRHGSPPHKSSSGREYWRAAHQVISDDRLPILAQLAGTRIIQPASQLRLPLVRQSAVRIVLAAGAAETSYVQDCREDAAGLPSCRAFRTQVIRLF